MNPFRTIKEFIESGGGAGTPKKKKKPVVKEKKPNSANPFSVGTVADTIKRRKAMMEKIK